MLLSTVAAASRGLAGILITLGSFALLTGLYAIVFERRSWAGLPGRKIAAIVGLGGLVVTVVGGGIPGPPAPTAGDPTANAPAAAQTVAATPAATEAGPARAACSDEASVRQVQDKVLVCTVNEAGALVWLDKATSEKLAANRAAEEAAAEEAASGTAPAEEAVAKQAATEKAAAEADEPATAEQETAAQTGEKPAAAEQDATAPAAVHPNKSKSQWCEFPPSTPECNSGPKREK
ncbi:hypothetical protein LVY72_12275 [Arthrobacter sp. I2-34]|uniref:Uncharacterized protein n=1 Tax=Arthrobacter hankyongi TaxID=2904801 RepID=A0ABS9L7M1_9MICC|nr:hypothetical protein [Arthrobacter hankyongi]MCG2622681.1 hypothetical protein [Arthrobacter hankyongi]